MCNYPTPKFRGPKSIMNATASYQEKAPISQTSTTSPKRLSSPHSRNVCFVAVPFQIAHTPAALRGGGGEGICQKALFVATCPTVEVAQQFIALSQVPPILIDPVLLHKLPQALPVLIDPSIAVVVLDCSQLPSSISPHSRIGEDEGFRSVMNTTGSGTSFIYLRSDSGANSRSSSCGSCADGRKDFLPQPLVACCRANTRGEGSDRVSCARPPQTQSRKTRSMMSVSTMTSSASASRSNQFADACAGLGSSITSSSDNNASDNTMARKGLSSSALTNGGFIASHRFS